MRRVLWIVCLFAMLFPPVGWADTLIPPNALGEEDQTDWVELTDRFAESQIKARELLRDFPLLVSRSPEALSRRIAELGEKSSREGLSAQERLSYSTLYTLYKNYQSLIKTSNALSAHIEKGGASPDILASAIVAQTLSDGDESITTYDALRERYFSVRQKFRAEILQMQRSLNNLNRQILFFKNKNTEPLTASVDSSAPQRLRDEGAALQLASEMENFTLHHLDAKNYLVVLQEEHRNLLAVQRNVVFPLNLLEEKLTAIQKKIDWNNQLLGSVERSLDEVASIGLTNDAGAPPLSASATLYRKRLIQQSYWEYRLGGIYEELEWLLRSKELWQMRYRLFHNQMGGGELWHLSSMAGTEIKNLQKEMEESIAWEAELYAELEVLNRDIEKSEGEAQEHLKQAVQIIYRTMGISNQQAYRIQQRLFFYETLRDEARQKTDTLRLVEQVGSLSKETLLKVWNARLWSDADNHITVKKFTLAMLALMLSFYLSGKGSRWVQYLLLKSFARDSGTAYALQKIFFYIIWISFILVILQMMNIPLATFAFFGGAIALAFGLSAQNLLGNLISSFIILFTRPFRMGDVITVDGVRGTVEEILSNSTRLRMENNEEIIFPNRYLLESKIGNLTAKEKDYRESLCFSVPLDVDSKVVEQRALQLAAGHPAVLQDPPPQLLFRDFDADTESSVFELFFWVSRHQATTDQVASDLRHSLLKEIQQRFRG